MSTTNEHIVQAAFLQRGEDGLAALPGGARNKGVWGHLQEVKFSWFTFLFLFPFCQDLWGWIMI